MNDYVVVSVRGRAVAGVDLATRYRSRGAGVSGEERLADVELHVDEASLSTTQAADARRDDKVLAIAPSMPTRLIQPLDVKETSGTSWGIAAVRADVSRATGAGVKIAVLDTGIDSSHPAFLGVDLVQCDFSGDGDGDVQGHGTHCAGTIFGRDIGGVRIGIARGVNQAFIGKVLDNRGSGNTLMLLKGLTWALQNGAHVISMSLGFDFPGLVERMVHGGWPVALATSHALESYHDNVRAFDAVMQLVSAHQAFGACGIVVAASGNESRADRDPKFRLGASLPSAADGVLAIGALAKGGTLHSVAPFSNGRVDLVAPGVNILSSKSGGGLAALSGTSMACPHVAGVAALWWDHLGSHEKGASDDVRLQLLSTARLNAIDTAADAHARGRGLVTAP